MTPDDAPWLKEAQIVVGNRELPLREEIQLRYAIGKYFDDLRDYPAAFTNFQRANELTKQITPRYDALKWERQFKVTADFYEIRRIAEARPGAELSRARYSSSECQGRAPRWRSKFLPRYLRCTAAGELPFCTIAAAAYESSEADTNKRAAMRRELASSYLGLLEGLSSDAQRVTDKMPLNFLVLGLIHSIFPNSRIIYMRRNPVDTCLSIYFQNFGVSHSYANDLEDLTHSLCSSTPGSWGIGCRCCRNTPFWKCRTRD